MNERTKVFPAESHGDEERGKPLALPLVLQFFCVTSVLLTLIALAAKFICRNFLHLTRAPYGLYLLPPDGNFSDLTMFRLRFSHFHSLSFFSRELGAGYLYPAAVAPFYRIFFLFSHEVPAFLVCGSLILGGLAIGLTRVLCLRGVSLLSAMLFVWLSVFCSYAFYFELNRANMEIFVWLFSAGGVFALLRRRPWLAAACVGIAGAMKLFPFIYLGLFLSRRLYRQSAFALGVGGVFSVLSLWAICPSLAVASAGILKGLQSFGAIYVAHLREIGVDHSLFALIKYFLGELGHERYQTILTIYVVIAGLLASAAYFGRIRHLPMINQVLCLSTASILLPPTSFDYTLLHLYTPWALLVVYAVDTARRGRPPVAGLWPVFGCFVLLLSQIGEVIVHGARVGGQIKAVVLLTLFFLGMYFPFDRALRSEFSSSGQSPASW